MKNTWQVKPGHNTTEGTKNFIPVPDEKKYNKRVVINFTQNQVKIIDSYCTINKLSRNDLFREAIVSFFESQNFSIDTDKPEDDPRQQKMF